MFRTRVLDHGVECAIHDRQSSPPCSTPGGWNKKRKYSSLKRWQLANAQDSRSEAGRLKMSATPFGAECLSGDPVWMGSTQKFVEQKSPSRWRAVKDDGFI
jgi:hypothetical protein